MHAAVMENKLVDGTLRNADSELGYSDIGRDEKHVGRRERVARV